MFCWGKTVSDARRVRGLCLSWQGRGRLLGAWVGVGEERVALVCARNCQSQVGTGEGVLSVRSRVVASVGGQAVVPGVWEGKGGG